MKKYIIGMVAMIMIVVASAFAIAGKTTPVKADTTYWFEMDDQGNVTTTQLTDPSTLCPLPGDGCAREYNASQTEIVGGVRQVKASQVDLEIASRAKN
jgi:hypothetical protein